MNRSDDVVARVADAVRQADALLIGAGAGMGVDSGLPDFRGNEGFWNAYPPFKKRNLSFVDMANPDWFHREPHVAWGFYGHRFNLYSQADPHQGFEILLNWGRAKPDGYFVFTSNVDGHFQKAGFDADRIVECHGSILHQQCRRPCSRSIWSSADARITVDEETFEAQEPLPRCPHCENLARPNILMFGDFEWVGDRSAEQSRRYAEWSDSLDPARLVVVELGAGTAVPSVRHECEHVAGRGAALVRINPREPQVPAHRGFRESFSLPLGALDALSMIDQQL